LPYGGQLRPDTLHLEDDNSIQNDDNAQINTFPNVGTTTKIVQEKIDWRDEVIAFSPETFSENIVVYEDVEKESVPQPEPVVETSPAPPAKIKLPDSYVNFSGSNNDLDISQKDIMSCGELKYPVDEYGDKRSILSLAEEDVVVCLGEAVANDCESASVTTRSTDGYVSRVYVLPQTDGSCGISIATLEDKVKLCSIEKVLNSRLHPDQQKIFADWQKDFVTNPGDTITTAYFNVLFETDADYLATIGCKWYEF
jgi:hypothetical protein